MVLRKDEGWKNTPHQQRVQWKVRHAHDTVRTNELFHAISPYDEIPAVRDLTMKLSSEPRQDPGVLRQRLETKQTRQEAMTNSHRHSAHQNRLSQIEKLRFVLREQNHRISDDCCRIRRKFDSPMQFHDMIPVNNDILFSIMVDNRNHFENDLDEDMMLASAAGGDVFVSLPRTIRKRYRRKTSTSCWG